MTTPTASPMAASRPTTGMPRSSTTPAATGPSPSPAATCTRPPMPSGSAPSRSSTYEPLAALATKMRREETYHLLHADAWLRRLPTAAPETRDRLAGALEACGPDAQEVFAPLAGEEELVRDGLLPRRCASSTPSGSDRPSDARADHRPAPEAARSPDGRSGEPTTSVAPRRVHERRPLGGGRDVVTRPRHRRPREAGSGPSWRAIRDPEIPAIGLVDLGVIGRDRRRSPRRGRAPADLRRAARPSGSCRSGSPSASARSAWPTRSRSAQLRPAVDERPDHARGPRAPAAERLRAAARRPVPVTANPLDELAVLPSPSARTAARGTRRSRTLRARRSAARSITAPTAASRSSSSSASDARPAGGYAAHDGNRRGRDRSRRGLTDHLAAMRHSAAHMMAAAVLGALPRREARHRSGHQGWLLLRLRPAPSADARRPRADRGEDARAAGRRPSLRAVARPAARRGDRPRSRAESAVQGRDHRGPARVRGADGQLLPPRLVRGPLPRRAPRRRPDGSAPSSS